MQYQEVRRLVLECVLVLVARAIHTNTLRGLKIYLLFNRLVRRYVMSVNVNVNVGMYVMKEALLS